MVSWSTDGVTSLKIPLLMKIAIIFILGILFTFGTSALNAQGYGKNYSKQGNYSSSPGSKGEARDQSSDDEDKGNGRLAPAEPGSEDQNPPEIPDLIPYDEQEDEESEDVLRPDEQEEEPVDEPVERPRRGNYDERSANLRRT